MIKLTGRESELVKRIVDRMTIRERKAYQEHRTGGGFVPGGVTDYYDCQKLHQKGWMTDPGELISGDPVYLTRNAWERFNLAEWLEVEEEAMQEVRGNTYGSW